MEDALVLADIYKIFPSYPKPTVALCGISFCVKKGSLVVIGGANGSGKSVLMQIIARLIEPSGGTVQTASKPGLVFQDAAVQILGDTPREDVCVGLRNKGLKKKEADKASEEALASVSLLKKADFPAEALSGGEKRRLSVASMLALQRDCIIFDEPYANLDYPGVREVNALIKQLCAEGKTVLLLTHELEKCLALAQQVIILNKGKLVFDGSPEEALKQNLEEWGIHNPLCHYDKLSDLEW